MNNFFKTFAASLLAVVVGSIISGVVMLMIFGGMMAAVVGSSQKSAYLASGTVLTIDVGEPLNDGPAALDFQMIAMGRGAGTTIRLLDVLNAIERAAMDSRIEGICLTSTGAGAVSPAQSEELRVALTGFKESGKWVVAYAEGWSQMGYWLASVSDKVFINPAGGMEWRGGAAQLMFFKGLVDKLGIDMQVIRHGTYKSAVEPFIMERMSEANRTQVEKYLGSMWGVMLEDVSTSRGVDVVRLQRYADELAVVFPEDAVELGLADGVLYEDQVDNYLAALVDGTALIGESVDYTALEQMAAPKKVAVGDYISTRADANHYAKDKVGIIYVDGDIVDGESSRGSVGSATIAEQLRRARESDDIKAVVLRVNSPGGSALASEIMWREVELLKAKKPVIVSMGEYAASGGYYISCGADVVMADRVTVTGSIGVFGLMPNVQKMMRDKLGITVDVARTARHADIGTPFRPLDNAEREYILKGIERVYSTFVGHVAQGRNLTVPEVDAIGSGRVWLGVDAHDIGLVDGFGGLKDAIALAADRAGISDNYRVTEITDVDNKVSMMMRMLFSAKIKVELPGEDMAGIMQEYAAIKRVMTTKGAQARLPFFVIED